MAELPPPPSGGLIMRYKGSNIDLDWLWGMKANERYKHYVAITFLIPELDLNDMVNKRQITAQTGREISEARQRHADEQKELTRIMDMVLGVPGVKNIPAEYHIVAPVPAPVPTPVPAPAKFGKSRRKSYSRKKSRKFRKSRKPRKKSVRKVRKSKKKSNSKYKKSR